jgi:hypothetical protein
VRCCDIMLKRGAGCFRNVTLKKRREPEFIDQVFAKASPKRSFSVVENERFGLFRGNGSINSGTVVFGFTELLGAPSWI